MKHNIKPKPSRFKQASKKKDAVLQNMWGTFATCKNREKRSWLNSNPMIKKGSNKQYTKTVYVFINIVK